MSTKDYIPQNLTAFANWMENFYFQLQKLAAKYNISAATMLSLKNDNDWIQYWAQARVAANMQEKQLTDFIGTIADGNLGAHLTTLEKAGYIAIDKQPAGKRFRTLVALTPTGRKAFLDHLAFLKGIVGER